MTISGTNRFSPPAPLPGDEPLGPTPPPGNATPRRLGESYFWLLLTFGVALVVGLIYGMWRISRTAPEPLPRAAPAAPAAPANAPER